MLELIYDISELYKSNPCEYELKKFKDNQRKKYFEKFIKLINGKIYIYNTIQNFDYYKDDKKLMDIMNNSDNLYLKTCGKNFMNSLNPYQISRSYDIIKGIDVTSSVNTTCTLAGNGYKIFTFNIKKGTHYYPLVMPMSNVVYYMLTLNFNDTVDQLKIYGFYLPNDMHDMMIRCSKIITYQNMWFTDTNIGFIKKDHK